jgi:hypothetical protein
MQFLKYTDETSSGKTVKAFYIFSEHKDILAHRPVARQRPQNKQ